MLCSVAFVILGCDQQEPQTADEYYDDITVEEGYADVTEDITGDTEPPYVEAYEPFVPPPVYDPVAPDPLTAEEWRAVADREPFEREGELKPKPREPPRVPDPSAERLFDSLSTVAWVLLIILLLAGLGYVIYRQRLRPDLSVSRSDYSATDALLNTAPDALAADLASKIGTRDFRMAIRLRFGQVLQELRSRKLLVWVPGHTNLDYERALPAYLRGDFAALADDFAYATYAGRELYEERFERFADKADTFLLVAYGPNDPRRAAALAPQLPSA